MAKCPRHAIERISSVFSIVWDNPGRVSVEQSAGLSGLRWHRARDPAAGIWKGLLLVVIYKDQASLRMYRFPWPLESDLASSGFFWSFSSCLQGKTSQITWREETLTWLKERIRGNIISLQSRSSLQHDQAQLQILVKVHWLAFKRCKL